MKQAIAAMITILSLVHAHAQQTLTAVIDVQATQQTIRNFSASDAWSCKYVGNWPLAKKEAIADWLFSYDTTENGAPKGIGLSMWRFNIGAGSAQQGAASGIANQWRREESFWEPDNSWNFSRQAGQLWFLQAAQKRGVQQFLGFLNSPPVQLTTNGKAFATGGNCNISDSNFAAFARYMQAVISGVQKKTGVLLNYISPVNEPQWAWSDGGQEGCPYNNTQISGVVKQLSRQLAAAHLPTKILVAEAGKINYLYEAADKPEKGRQTTAFFTDTAATFIGNLPQVYRAIAAHSYFTTSPDSTAIRARKKLAAAVHNIKGLEYWQSEYCILGDNEGEINGNKKDLGMNAALYMARVIHNDLTVANASAWQWWLGVSSGDYKDGLVYVSHDTADGSYEDSKLLWVLGNYSRFVRPGAQRVAVALDDSTQAKQVLVSAYTSNKNISVVIVNNNTIPVTIALQYAHGSGAIVRSYTTDAAASLQPATPGNPSIFSIPARAVVTLTGTIARR